MQNLFIWKKTRVVAIILLFVGASVITNIDGALGGRENRPTNPRVKTKNIWDENPDPLYVDLVDAYWCNEYVLFQWDNNGISYKIDIYGPSDDWTIGPNPTSGEPGECLVDFLPEGGPYTWHLWVQYESGGSYYDPLESHPSFGVDRTDPSGSITINSGAEWTNSHLVILSLTYFDGYSGVYRVRYQNVDQGWSSWEEASATKSWALPSGDGVKQVRYQIRDKAGNSGIYQDDIKLDGTPPIITDNQQGDDLWRNTSGTTYDVDFADFYSLLDSAQYKVTTEPGQGGSILINWTDIFSEYQAPSYPTNWSVDFASCQEGINYVSVQVYDYAENCESLDDIFYVKKDTQPPATNCTLEGETDDDVYISNVTVTLNATDPFSHVNITMYTLDEGEWDTYTESFIVSEKGEHTVSFFSIDNAGNEEEKQSCTFTIATPKPDLDCEGSLSWTDVKPGSTVEDSFTVKNIGDTGSSLNWEITSSPSWGSSWSYTPRSGSDLAAGSSITVTVSVVAPDEKEETFTGNITVCNRDNTSDCCLIPVTLITPVRTQSTSRVLLHCLQRLLSRFPLLERILMQISHLSDRY